ncbi:FAD synthetase [Schizosaccharomyces cryophilus OY26]|uniref:FAD synthase n=1 Tax=Schizosaccharomyces cryophilus (strain OY26 / ATCC MYA-4695 / CBS 11777 / NBRC 106824 / NRRL Y48691) TaxID=653667 RepID=S9VQ21_SCHCR|nr:FAD synthetase [Schizosaccharomyces cryophilus OY26]EPY50058.1 FAD synthetase [Schizosaccharomyces cryophilus OY26]
MEALEDVYNKIKSIYTSYPSSEKNRVLKQRLITSLKFLDYAFESYGASRIAMSFNGGKDCLVLLLLCIYCLREKYGGSMAKQKLAEIPFVFVRPKDEFYEMDEFVQDCKNLYGLNIISISLPMKEAFTLFLADNPNIQAILIGIRRLDPHGLHRVAFEMTDKGWPKFMRVQPILDWTYSEVWDLLLETKTKYCILYDKGYTSLGGISDTSPNPALKNKDGSYSPAYLLPDASLERFGRNQTVPFERTNSRYLYESGPSSYAPSEVS